MQRLAVNYHPLTSQIEALTDGHMGIYEDDHGYRWLVTSYKSDDGLYYVQSTSAEYDSVSNWCHSWHNQTDAKQAEIREYMGDSIPAEIVPDMSVNDILRLADMLMQIHDTLIYSGSYTPAEFTTLDDVIAYISNGCE